MGTLLLHPLKGVHYSALLVVPEPGELRGEGAGGGLIVDVLHRPQVVDLLRQGW